MINKWHKADEGTSGRLVCSVSTVKDSLTNVQEFVRRNLAAGVDHMFVFLDDADPEIHAVLRDHPHVTCVRTGKRYWQGHRPSSLNTRQVTNANLVNLLLAAFAEVRWLFHIDGDECLDVDKEALLAIENGCRAVHLRTLEAVAQARWNGPVSQFKRRIDPDDLQLLAALGIIEKPTLRRYFNGHLAGKPGVAPGLDLHLRIHHVADSRTDRVVAAEGDALNVLHYESFSGEEFVRKWSAHLSEGAGTARFSGRKGRVRAAVAALLANETLGEKRRNELLLEVYRRHIEDDLPTLVELGFVVQPDPSRHNNRPGSFTRAAKDDLGMLLGLLVSHPDKSCLGHHGGLARRPALLREVRARLGEGKPSLARRIDAALGPEGA